MIYCPLISDADAFPLGVSDEVKRSLPTRIFKRWSVIIFDSLVDRQTDFGTNVSINLDIESVCSENI